MNSKKILLFIAYFTLVIVFAQLSYSADQKNEMITPMFSLLLGKSVNCSDSVFNGDETDIDCGGSCPLKCGTGNSCIGSTDCISGVCTSDICQAPTCADGVLNGDESDLDCGGSCPGKCADGNGCTGSTDCISGVCTSDVCQIPTCTDGVLNGDESYVDCGGAVCPNCVACNDNRDCSAEESCVENICQPL